MSGTDPSKRTPLDDLREELGREFAEAADRDPRRTSRRGRDALLVLLAVLALTPGAVALAGGFDRVQNHTIWTDGKHIKVDGQEISCPATPEMIQDLDADPCHFFTEPAPAPALSPGSPCPDFVKDFLREVKDNPSLLPGYSDLPGYPFADCPTEEQLRQVFQPAR